MRENTGRWTVTFTGATVTAMLLLGPVASTAQAQARTEDQTAPRDSVTAVARVSPETSTQRLAAAGTTVTARWSRAIDTTSQSAVNAAYRASYAPKVNLSIGWLLGSLLGCQAGSTSSATNAATLSSLNFVRSLGGLAPVTFSPTLNASAQQAALIMAANNNLSHSPGSSWKCWSSTGAKAAGKSNLALAYPSLGAGKIIDLYMDDPGDTNTAAGHRRWILNPFSTVMGSGSTKTANALTVIGPSSAARPNPRWVGWPSAGYFPNEIEPNGRWSISAGLKSISFATAKVAVYRGTTRIPVHRFGVHTGYGQPTLVWQMPSTFSKTAAYRVVITGIKKAGVTRTYATQYTVRLFTPTP